MLEQVVLLLHIDATISNVVWHCNAKSSTHSDDVCCSCI